MFVRQNQQQFRNSNADVQIFYSANVALGNKSQSWNKPIGVSHIYIMLIGAGALGDGTNGGGSGAVTVWYGAAQNVPNVLSISVSPTGATYIFPFSTPSTALLSADAASTITGGTAMTANQFSNMGFFQSVAGQDGMAGAITASATTFLSGGGNGSGAAGNYGYSYPGNGYGFLQLQPVIVGLGNTVTTSTIAAGAGCGGSFIGVNKGGPGLAIIASW